MSSSPFGDEPPSTKTCSTPGRLAAIRRAFSVAASVSASLAPGGSSMLTEMRETSSGGMKLPGICTMK